MLQTVPMPSRPTRPVLQLAGIYDYVHVHDGQVRFVETPWWKELEETSNLNHSCEGIVNNGVWGGQLGDIFVNVKHLTVYYMVFADMAT